MNETAQLDQADAIKALQALRIGPVKVGERGHAFILVGRASVYYSPFSKAYCVIWGWPGPELLCNTFDCPEACKAFVLQFS